MNNENFKLDFAYFLALLAHPDGVSKMNRGGSNVPDHENIDVCTREARTTVISFVLREMGACYQVENNPNLCLHTISNPLSRWNCFLSPCYYYLCPLTFSDCWLV